MENITDYDDVFEELYIKYKSSVTVLPEIRLVGIFLSSAVTFHFSKMVIEKASNQIPDFNEIMMNNPKLKKEYEDAARARVSENGRSNGMGEKIGGFMNNSKIGNFIGGLFGNKSSEQSQGQGQGQSQNPSQGSPIRVPSASTSQFNGQRQREREREKDIDMEGPRDVDDILNKLSNPTSEKKLKDIDDDTNISEFISHKRRTKNV